MSSSLGFLSGETFTKYCCAFSNNWDIDRRKKVQLMDVPWRIYIKLHGSP
jgi:hypothetical protein